MELLCSTLCSAPHLGWRVKSCSLVQRGLGLCSRWHETRWPTGELAAHWGWSDMVGGAVLHGNFASSFGEITSLCYIFHKLTCDHVDKRLFLMAHTDRQNKDKWVFLPSVFNNSCTGLWISFSYFWWKYIQIQILATSFLLVLVDKNHRSCLTKLVISSLSVH